MRLLVINKKNVAQHASSSFVQSCKKNKFVVGLIENGTAICKKISYLFYAHICFHVSWRLFARLKFSNTYILYNFLSTYTRNTRTAHMLGIFKN